MYVHLRDRHFIRDRMWGPKENFKLEGGSGEGGRKESEKETEVQKYMLYASDAEVIIVSFPNNGPLGKIVLFRKCML